MAFAFVVCSIYAAVASRCARLAREADPIQPRLSRYERGKIFPFRLASDLRRRCGSIEQMPIPAAPAAAREGATVES